MTRLSLERLRPLATQPFDPPCTSIHIHTLSDDIPSMSTHTKSFGALTLFVGRQEKHPSCRNWTMRCRCGYLPGARCRLSAYGSADVTVITKPYHLLPRLNQYWFSGTGLPTLSWSCSSSSSMTRNTCLQRRHWRQRVRAEIFLYAINIRNVPVDRQQFISMTRLLDNQLQRERFASTWFDA